VNILLIQLKRIGDLVLTAPAITALHGKFPDAGISIIVSSACAELLPAIPFIDGGFSANSARTWFRVVGGHVDYCIDFTRNDRSALLTRLSRAKVRIASERRRQRAAIRSRAYNRFVIAPVRQLHTIDYHLRLLEPLGLSGPAPPIQLVIPPNAKENAKRLRQIHRLDQEYVVYHPGSTRAEKFWEAQRWAEVIEHAGKNNDLVLTGASSALEQKHLGEIKARLRRPIIDLSGQTDLLTLAALIEGARLLVTVDSAPLHLAAATRTPQVALFGPTNPFHWRPRDSAALVLQGTSSVPLREFAADQPPLPMKQISTRAVIDAMDALLSMPAARGL
jgi:predicted lipopolysaccharide heptosyltransferase III